MIFFYPKIAKVADPIGTLEDLERMTLSELDLQNEISGIETLRKTLTQHQEFLTSAVQYPLSFPCTYPELSSDTILVSEKLTGKSFRELLESGALPYPVLLDFFFQHVFCMLLDGYFHEDIHSGNIFYQDEKIYLLDNGSIGFAPKNLREGLVTMFYHLTHDEFSEAAI
jgi:ubiquinone biosynthesis protein